MKARGGDEDEPRIDGDGVHRGPPPIFCEQLGFWPRVRYKRIRDSH
jgi:hypothetical protein